MSCLQTLLCMLCVASPSMLSRHTPVWGVAVCTLLAGLSCVITVLNIGGSLGLTFTSLIMTTAAHLPVASPWWFELVTATPNSLMAVAAICIICIVFDCFCVLEKNINATFAVISTLCLCCTSIGANTMASHTIDAERSEDTGGVITVV
eukprot:Blabericola_migrator_1__588@NODE_1144_length_5294_cov_54_488234_g778_i0_p6_GENE_NODE_1144_length_5294_cov_54_488234_g778_i0NODE_1144_length_5294_cov_54_488234_g778_i0_p6_ORF_typecomplete_len149_score12_74YfhO/PF09586_10/0_04MCLC/PF05934_11/0_19MgtE/PF01769_16/1_8e03MgtE/PF01769_16/0_056YesK/PF14150_6/73YesK/PF14150_6/1_3YibE_F/PF07907_11/4_4e02YibE_F/PF07907_11/0_72_NODE_1144_length_5294_cov_54_488234_g778_i046905136